jgi:hypothetical protein
MPAIIMLVEDNPGDVRLMRETLVTNDNGIQLLVASDGIEALDMNTTILQRRRWLGMK